jgi:hypothetical protein
MSKSQDEILASELGKVGEMGGKISALFSKGPSAGKAAETGASLGAQLAAKFLPTETYTEKLTFKIAPEKALKLGYSVLAKVGELQAETDTPPYPFLKAVIGSGFLGLNPAVVYLEILEGDSTGCEVTITAAAKEGLIKQHTAAKAAQRVIPALRDLANGA